MPFFSKKNKKNLNNQQFLIVIKDTFSNQRASILTKKHKDFAKTDELQLKDSIKICT